MGEELESLARALSGGLDSPEDLGLTSWKGNGYKPVKRRRVQRKGTPAPEEEEDPYGMSGAGGAAPVPRTGRTRDPFAAAGMPVDYDAASYPTPTTAPSSAVDAWSAQPSTNGREGVRRVKDDGDWLGMLTSEDGPTGGASPELVPVSGGGSGAQDTVIPSGSPHVTRPSEFSWDNDPKIREYEGQRDKMLKSIWRATQNKGMVYDRLANQRRQALQYNAGANRTARLDAEDAANRRASNQRQDRLDQAGLIKDREQIDMWRGQGRDREEDNRRQERLTDAQIANYRSLDNKRTSQENRLGGDEESDPFTSPSVLAAAFTSINATLRSPDASRGEKAQAASVMNLLQQALTGGVGKRLGRGQDGPPSSLASPAAPRAAPQADQGAGGQEEETERGPDGKLRLKKKNPLQVWGALGGR